MKPLALTKHLADLRVRLLLGAARTLGFRATIGPALLPRAKSPPPKPPKLDSVGLLFGYSAIARFLGVTRGQARALVRRRAIPAFELDGVPCARKSRIISHLNTLEAANGQRA